MNTPYDDSILFWADRASGGHIGRANMDGSQRQAIITSEIERPVAIAIDFEGKNTPIHYNIGISKQTFNHTSHHGFHHIKEKFKLHGAF